MKHAGKAALDAVDEVLAGVRAIAGVKEKSRGVFYRKGVASFHVHEDPAGLFADVRLKGAWKRLRVSTVAERRRALAAIRRDWAEP